MENEFIETQLVPGVYELIEINNAIGQIITDSDYDLVDKSKFKKDLTVFSIEFNIIPDTISMKTVSTTSNSLHFNSERKSLGIYNQRLPSRNSHVRKTSHDNYHRQSSSEVRLRRWFNC